MEISFDFSELTGFADAMSQASGTLGQEMAVANTVLLHEGVGYAQEAAPRGDSGNLAGSIRILEGPGKDGGSYGSDLVYAWQREEGGTITARNAKALAFEIDGKLIMVKSVTQAGSHYMAKSLQRLEPRVNPIYQLAIDRTLGRI